MLIIDLSKNKVNFFHWKKLGKTIFQDLIFITI